MKNVISSKLMTNSQKPANKMQQRNLVFLRLPCVVSLNNEKHSWLLVMESENERAQESACGWSRQVKWIDNAQSHKCPLNSVTQ